MKPGKYKKKYSIEILFIGGGNLIFEYFDKQEFLNFDKRLTYSILQPKCKINEFDNKGNLYKINPVNIKYFRSFINKVIF